MMSIGVQLFLLGAVTLLAVSNLWLYYRVLCPLRRLAAQTTEIAAGNLAAFQQPCGGVREIDILRHTLASMAGHVRRTQEDTIAYRHALTDGQEAERARIAHELHDDTVQSLIAIAQGIDLASGWIEPDPTRAQSMLQAARTQAVDSVDNLRRLIADLRPPALEELGLVPALKMLGTDEAEITVQVTVSGTQRRLSQTHELTLFRAAQEAVRNASRHGHAQQIATSIHYEPGEVRLTVTDDGQGFHVPQHLDDLAQMGHYGLLGMTERLQQFNGKVQITSQPGQGTQVMIRLPLIAQPQPDETVRDPVCGALIQPQQAYGSVQFEGERYYFCCPVCQGAFQKNPHLYLTAETA